MKIKRITILIDDESNECLYADGKAWESTGEVTVYACDIAEAAGGDAIYFEHKSIDHCWDRWPSNLAIALQDPKSPA